MNQIKFGENIVKSNKCKNIEVIRKVKVIAIIILMKVFNQLNPFLTMKLFINLIMEEQNHSLKKLNTKIFSYKKNNQLDQFLT